MGTTEESKRSLSEAHRDAIARGRSEGIVVRRYLESLRRKGRPGRKVDLERARVRVGEVVRRLEVETDPLVWVELRQEELDLREKLTHAGSVDETAGLEDEFVRVAKSFSRRKGISYRAWRDAHVPAAVLERAGITREHA